MHDLRGISYNHPKMRAVIEGRNIWNGWYYQQISKSGTTEDTWNRLLFAISCVKCYLNSFLNNIKLWCSNLQCYKSYHFKIFGALLSLGEKFYFSTCVHNNKGICRLWDTDVQATAFIPLDDDSCKKIRASKNLSNSRERHAPTDLEAIQDLVPGLMFQ